MSTLSQLDIDKIFRLVGTIVLESQRVERNLKLILPFVDSGAIGLGESLQKLRKQEKHSLGKLVGNFVDSSTSDSLDFAQYMARLVSTRNQVVHHFHENFGAQLESGAQQEVLTALEQALLDLKNFGNLIEKIVLSVLEALRDTTYAETPEYEQFAAVCASFCRRIAT